MRVKIPPRLRSSDPIGDRVSDYAREAFQELGQIQILSGKQVARVELPNATTVRINHGLGRPVSGWFVTDIVGPTATGRIQRVVSAAAETERQLWIQANGWGATITVALWVF